MQKLDRVRISFNSKIAQSDAHINASSGYFENLNHLSAETDDLAGGDSLFVANIQDQDRIKF